MKQGLLLFSILFATTACGQRSNSSDEDATPYVFPGVDSAERFDDGSVTLKWSQVPTTDVSFAIFRRLPDSTYNWEKPFLTVRSKPGGTDNVSSRAHFQEENSLRCYVVRFIHDNISDTNQSEICVEPAID